MTEIEGSSSRFVLFASVVFSPTSIGKIGSTLVLHWF